MFQEDLLNTMKDHTIEGTDIEENSKKYTTTFKPFDYLNYSFVKNMGSEYWHHTGMDFNLIKEAQKMDIAEAHIYGVKKAQDIILRTELEQSGDLSTTGGSLESVVQGLQDGRMALNEGRGTPSYGKNRSAEPLPGWSKSNDVRLDYLTKIASSYWRTLTALHNRRLMDLVEENKGFGEQTPQMMKYMDIYKNNVLGRPSYFPEEILNDRSYKIKGTPFYWQSDEFGHRVTKSLKKFFNLDIKVDARFMEKLKAEHGPVEEPSYNSEGVARLNADGTPKMATVREGDKVWDAVQEKINEQIDKGVSPDKITFNIPVDSEVGKRLFSSKLSAFSKLEAKVEMITMLSTPKTMAHLIVGMHANAIINDGFDSFRKAGDINYFRNINPEWDSMEKVHAFVDEHGGLDSYFKDMFSLSNYKDQKFQDFFVDLLSAVKKNQLNDDTSFFQIAKKHGIANEIAEKAGWFMRKGERYARRKAWLSAYINAKESFEVTKKDFDYKDPIIIQIANKSVENSQFIFNSASRPAFMATSLGKIFSRFQVHAFNNIKFRKNITDMALDQGMKPYTKEYQRFQRMVTIDTFMVIMASMIPMSIFATSVASPYQQILPMTEFLFGDDKKKRKAFYSVLPYPANILQPLLPVSSRYFTSFMALAMGNYDGFNSMLATMIPFGRLTKQINRSITNPMTAPDELLGVPLQKMGTLFSQIQKDDDRENQLGEGSMF